MSEKSENSSLVPDAVQEYGYIVYNPLTGEIYNQYPTLEHACLRVYEISKHGPFNVAIAYDVIGEFSFTRK